MNLKAWHWWRFDCLGQQIVRVSDGSPTPTHIAEKIPNRLFKHTIQLSKEVTLYLIIIPKYRDVSLEMYDTKHYRIINLDFPFCCASPISLHPIFIYSKTHYYRAPFNFTHFPLGDDNAYFTGADIRSKQHNNAPSSSDTVDACN